MRTVAVWLILITCVIASPARGLALEKLYKMRTLKRPNYVPGEVLVKFKRSSQAGASEFYRTRHGILTLHNLKRIVVQHVKLPKGMTVEEALKIYRNDPDVEYAEPNYIRQALQTTPNDPDFSKLWGLNNTGQTGGTLGADIDAPEAWDIATGSSNVVIAIIDSGVDYNHPDLSANIWINSDEIAGNGKDDDGNGYADDVRGWDFVNNDNDPMDSDGHGTHLAGIIAAKGNNSAGITGVCWTAKIMPLRFLDAFGYGTVYDELEAIDYAINNGANIINASFGGYDSSPLESGAISDAEAAGILFVAASGNDGIDNDTIYHYPSGYDNGNIIAVAATDHDDDLASLSNYGSASVDVAAPGISIYSSMPGRQTVWSDDFDDDDISDWVTGGEANNTWATTSSLSSSGSYSLTESPGGNYENNTDSWAMAPLINLSGFSGPKLEFKLQGRSENQFDPLYVETSANGSSWISHSVLIEDTSEIYDQGISGTDLFGYWYSAVVDLGTHEGASTVYIRFRFKSDDSLRYDGWYIDDVAVTAAYSSSTSYDATEYQYFDGTSMAAAYVSGIAALIKSHSPSMSYTEIKAAIENTVDPLSLDVATGGRLNAYKALLIPAAPSGLSATSLSSSGISLSWTDNSSGESGFSIERKTGSAGIYSGVATVSANVSSYTDSGLSASTTYYYRVRAYTSTGNSRYSNETNAETLTPTSGGDGGGCFIATIACSSDHPFARWYPCLSIQQ